nr:G-type lectin S-receptor-like serine/threonine-protein kinase At4g27290 isoform X2 [Ipomoea batatas]
MPDRITVGRLNEIARSFHPEAEWNIRSGLLAHMDYTYFSPQDLGILDFIKAKLIPHSHRGNVRKDQILLAYCIKERQTIDVGVLINRSICEIASAEKKSRCFLSHPFLITELCRLAGVVINTNQEVKVQPQNFLSQQYIQSRYGQGQRPINDPGNDEDEDHGEDEPMEGAENIPQPAAPEPAQNPQQFEMQEFMRRGDEVHWFVGTSMYQHNRAAQGFAPNFPPPPPWLQDPRYIPEFYSYKLIEKGIRSRSSDMVIFFFFLVSSIISNLDFSVLAVDTLATNQTLSDGSGTTLVSASQTFVLGFFSPGSSRYRYLGIWYGNVPEQTVVWVANNNNPIPDLSGVIRLTPMGDLIIISSSNTENEANIVWRSNSSSSPGIKNPVLQLLDNGDTLLPGMKLGLNLKTKQEWYLTSWRSPDDPSTGDFSFTYRLDLLGLPTFTLRKNSTVQFRDGTWDGRKFGRYSLGDFYKGIFKQTCICNDENAYCTFQCLQNSTISRFVVNQTGLLKFYIWNHKNKGEWFSTPIQVDQCDKYGVCGNNSLCNANRLPLCECVEGFEPRLPLEWESLQWSGGCVRRTPLNCSELQGFRKITGIKLPANSKMVGKNRTTLMSSKDCEKACLGNCSCSAYAWGEGVGCAVWYGDELADMKLYYSEGQDLYIRMASGVSSQLNGRLDLCKHSFFQLMI